MGDIIELTTYDDLRKRAAAMESMEPVDSLLNQQVEDKDPLTVKEILLLVEDAVKQFGGYNYFDKHLNESIDIEPLVKRATFMDPEEVQKVLLKVVEEDEEHGEKFVMDFIGSLDDQPEEWFDKLLGDELSEYY